MVELGRTNGKRVAGGHNVRDDIMALNNRHILRTRFLFVENVCSRNKV